MADQLNPIVQKMIDAGESEDNIATVIKHYKAQAPRTDVKPIDPNETDNPLVAGIKGFGKNILEQFNQAGKFNRKDDPFAVHGASPEVEKFVNTPLAHPTGVDAVDSFTSPAGLAGLTAGVVGGLAESPAARGTVGRGLTTGGGALSRGGAALQSSEVPLGGVGYALGGKEGAAIGAGIPRGMQLAGKLLTKAGEAITPEPPVQPPAPHLDRSVPVQAGSLTQQQLRERVLGGTGTPPPNTAKPPLGGRLMTQAQPDAAVPPVTSPQPIAPPPQQLPQTPPPPPPLAAESPMQQPRVQAGAEVVGRQQGLTKQAVRQQTAPILGEAPGEASPILPKEPLGRIVDALKSLPPGAEREAYVARATSGKAQWQIENIRRTLEHLGLVVPVAAAAGMQRDSIMRMMASHDQQ